MTLKSHFLLYAGTSALTFIFIIAAYTTELNWASTSSDSTFTSLSQTCTLDLDIYTGLFKKNVQCTITGCSGVSYDQTDDFDCAYDDDMTSTCQNLYTSQNASKACLAFAVLKFLVILWPLYLVWKGDSGISIGQLRGSTFTQLIVSFVLMICCFTVTGNYRAFLLDYTSWYDSSTGTIYYIDWHMGSSWYLMLFAGIFNIGMMISSITLLYYISRASADRPEVYATAVIVPPPPVASVSVNSNGPSSYVPPASVVQGRVLTEDQNVLNKNLV